VHAEAERLLVGDLARPGDVRDVVDPEAAVVVAALARGLEARDVGGLDLERGGEFGVGGGAAELAR
jgi:hypothetical protein